MKISKFRTNADAEIDGVWVPVGEGLELRVARIGNPRYKAMIRNAGKSQRMATQLTGNIDMDAIEELTLKAIANHVLLDWKNLEDDDGDQIPYSVDKAMELLQIQDFRSIVEAIASDAQHFRDSDLEATKGNS
jgi:hypothetical protein